MACVATRGRRRMLKRFMGWEGVLPWDGIVSG
jgi:hypothetical protein